ncbi:hypothetical protein CBL_01963 [Carabus blaptoides fortunei]
MKLWFSIAPKRQELFSKIETMMENQKETTTAVREIPMGWRASGVVVGLFKGEKQRNRNKQLQFTDKDSADFKVKDTKRKHEFDGDAFSKVVNTGEVPYLYR